MAKKKKGPFAFTYGADNRYNVYLDPLLLTLLAWSVKNALVKNMDTADPVLCLRSASIRDELHRCRAAKTSHG